jgi:hypothetical protein
MKRGCVRREKLIDDEIGHFTAGIRQGCGKIGDFTVAGR